MSNITLVAGSTINGSYEFKPDGMPCTVNIKNDGTGPATVQLQMGSNLVMDNYNDPITVPALDVVQQAIPEHYHRGILVITSNTGVITAEMTK